MKRTILLIFAMVFCATTQPAQSQTQTEVHACTKQGATYDCDVRTFKQLLAAAKTVSIQAPKFDPTSLKQLQQLVTSLGKTVQPDPADLSFVLAAPDPDSVYFGPSDRKLATINVYYQSQLIWTESYFGQPDTRWVISAHAVIEQFRQDAKHP
jgi:hypothetical protein